jgi:signal transduction histidine kinase
MDQTKLSRFTRHYHGALRDHLAPAGPDGLAVARKLGGEAVLLGLETLELAKMHRAALATLLPDGVPPGKRDALTARAADFFAEANTAIVSERRLAVEAEAGLAELRAALGQKPEDPVKRLGPGGDADNDLPISDSQAAALLEETDQLQRRMQEMMRRVLTSQEEERRRMSLTLQDEIAQMLLGIQVRLLALKSEASVNKTAFQKELAITRRLVQDSVDTINRFARECGIVYEN